MKKEDIYILYYMYMYADFFYFLFLAGGSAGSLGSAAADVGACFFLGTSFGAAAAGFDARLGSSFGGGTATAADVVGTCFFLGAGSGAAAFDFSSL